MNAFARPKITKSVPDASSLTILSPLLNFQNRLPPIDLKTCANSNGWFELSQGRLNIKRSDLTYLFLLHDGEEQEFGLWLFRDRLIQIKNI